MWILWWVIPTISLVYLIYCIAKYNLGKKSNIFLILIGVILISLFTYAHNLSGWSTDGNAAWQVYIYAGGILPISISCFFMPNFLKKVKDNSNKAISWILGIISFGLFIPLLTHLIFVLFNLLFYKL